MVVSKREDRYRIWEARSSGALRFRTSLQSEENLGDLAFDFLSFCRLSSKFLDDHHFYGGVLISHQVNCPDATFQPKFPPPGFFRDIDDDYDKVDGISFPKTRPSILPTGATFSEDVDFATLKNPQTLVATVLLDQLRETWGPQLSSKICA